MTIWTYTLFPVAAAVLGSIVSVYRPPSPVQVSGIQHFAAGVVFAAAAGEILPDLKHHGVWPVLLGGVLGVIVMLLIRRLEDQTKGSLGLLAAVGVDVFIDGLVLGLGFTSGQREGLLLTIALTIEILFLGLSVASEVGNGRMSGAAVIGTTAGLALLLPAGVALSYPVGGLPAPVLTGFFAFGLVALLYLVTEELLVEAHEVPERAWVTAMFFAGFLLLLLLEDAISA